MPCPHCGAEHEPDTTCKSTTENQSKPKTETANDKHALTGLDNPFWRPEKPAA